MGRLSFAARYGHWAVVVLIGACAVAAACGGGDQAASTSSSSGSSGPGESSGGTSGDPGGSSGSNGGSSGGSNGDGASGGQLPEGATEPNLKVAFIGDTASGDDFRSVLRLIKEEGADAVLVQGDLTYRGEDANDWFSAVDNEINAKAAGSVAQVTIPYFASRGNHDRDWDDLGAGLKARMEQWGVVSEHNDPTLINYSVVYKGLKIVMVSDRETRNPSRAEYVTQRLEGDKHIWKICSWHKNQRASNVGPKNDEMGWTIYENCRQHGAIVAQGHSHTYSRSKTLTNDEEQTVDAVCSDPFELCVGPGKHFFFDSSLGGHDMRSLNRTVAGRSYWASTFTGSFGALFIEFHVDGDPKKARGYFKTVGGQIVDPPASSGKTSFTIISSN